MIYAVQLEHASHALPPQASAKQPHRCCLLMFENDKGYKIPLAKLVLRHQAVLHSLPLHIEMRRGLCFVLVQLCLIYFDLM